MITFELSLKQLYKNSLIFAVIKFLPNIGILLLSMLIIFLSFGLIIPFNPLIGFVPYLFLTVSLIGFITNFYVYPKLKKYMISQLEDEDDEDDEYEEDDEDDEADGTEEDQAGRDSSEHEDSDQPEVDDVTNEDDIKRYF